MDVVRTRFGDQVDRRTRRSSESRRVDVGLDLEFLDGVRSGLDGKSSKGQVPGI